MDTSILIHLFFILSAIPIGALCGIIPTLGTSVAIIMMMPLLYYFPFDILLAFYTVMYMCQFFSNSVVAIWSGVAGDATSLPILYERKNVVAQNLQGHALKRTAQASVVSSIFSLSLLILMIDYLDKILGMFVATITNSLIMISILIIGLFWKQNRVWQNFIMISIGSILGLVGYHQNYAISILTFDNPSLYGGLPLLPIVLGVYAIPVMYDVFIEGYYAFKNHKTDTIKIKIPKTFINIPSTIRGTSIGFLLGLVPLIGTTVSSNVAHFCENYINPGKHNTLKRMTASESANNAAAISVLGPLLVLGVAIVPSEMLVASVLYDKGWRVTDITNTTYAWMLGSVLLSVGIVYTICVTYAGILMNLVQKYQMFVVIGFALVLIYGAWIYGQQTLSGGYHLTTLFFSVLLGIIFRGLTWVPIPLIISFIVSSISLPIFSRLFQLLQYYVMTYTSTL